MALAAAAAPRRGLFDVLFCRVVNVASGTPHLSRSPRASPVRAPGPRPDFSASQDSPALTPATADRRVKVLSLRSAAVAPEAPTSPSTALSSLREWNRNRGTSSPPPPASMRLGDASHRGDALCPDSVSDSRSAGVSSPAPLPEPPAAAPGPSASPIIVRAAGAGAAAEEQARAPQVEFSPVPLPETVDAPAQVGSDVAGCLSVSEPPAEPEGGGGLVAAQEADL